MEYRGKGSKAVVSRRYFTHVSRTCNEANQQSRLPQSDKTPKIPLRVVVITKSTKIKSKFHGSLTQKKKKKIVNENRTYAPERQIRANRVKNFIDTRLHDRRWDHRVIKYTRKKKKEVEKR